jgi:hypothetical protein
MFRSRLADEERALQADIHRRVPGCFRQCFQFSGNDLHRIIDDNIDASALFHDGFDEPVDVGGLGDVGDHRKAFAAERRRVFCRCVRGGGIDIVDDDVGAFARIGQYDIAADAAATAGNQRHLVFQSHGTPPYAA